MIKLGDRVSFINENIEGIVTSLKDKGMAGVTIEDDFEIPVLLSELIKIDLNETLNTNKEEKIKPRENTYPVGIFMAFDRMDEMKLELTLYNNISDELMFVMYEKESEVYKLKKP